MFRVTAIVDTFIKKTTEQSSDPGKEWRKGKPLDIEQILGEEKGYFFCRLGWGQGDWYLKRKDWYGLSDEPKQEGRWHQALENSTPTGCLGKTASAEGVKIGLDGSYRIASKDLGEFDDKILDTLKRMAANIDVPVGVLMGICSRESHVGLSLGRGHNKQGWGDNNNGFGVMQVDKNSHQIFGQPNPKSFEHLNQASKIFKGKLDAVAAKFPEWPDDKILEGALCVYNFGIGNLKTLEGRNRGTTNDDYGSDTMARAKWFQKYIDNESTPDPSPDEVSNPDAIDWTNFKSKVSKYFTVGEVTNNDSRRIPTDEAIKNNVIELAQRLDEIREQWGSAIAVTSWYRPPAINRAIGGATKSQHLTGRAADIRPVTGNIHKFQSWLDKGLWANNALGYGAKKGFVHIDLRTGSLRWDY